MRELKSPNDDAHHASLHRNDLYMWSNFYSLAVFVSWPIQAERENSSPYWVSEGLLYLWKRFGWTGKRWKEGEEEEIEGGLERGRREVRTCCRSPLCTRSGRRWSEGNGCQYSESMYAFPGSEIIELLQKATWCVPVLVKQSRSAVLPTLGTKPQERWTRTSPSTKSKPFF